MHRGSPRSAHWLIFGPSSTRSAPTPHRKITPPTFASNYAKQLPPCRRTSKNLRFLMTANNQTIFADLPRRGIGGVRRIRSSWKGLGPQAAFSEEGRCGDRG